MSVHGRWAEHTARRLGARHIFRPRLALFVAAFIGVAGLGWLVVAARQGWGEAMRQVPVVAFVALGAYLTCIRPVVAVGEREVLLRNVTRDVIVPWGALAGVETQYALTLTAHDGTTVRAWAAPAPSRFSAARATPSDLAAIGWDGDDGPPPASASLRADSGAAAILVRRAWASAKEHGRLDRTEVVVRWAWGWLAALAVTLVLAILAAAT